MSGYLHRGYADSLAEFGKSLALGKSKGFILKRRIPGTPYYDAMGCYPFFAVQDWSLLDVDLQELETQLVCLSVVTDPFGENDEDHLRRCFKDVIQPFKQHYIVDLSLSMKSFVSAHHQRYAKKALRDVQIERIQNPILFANEWTALYSILIKKHNIKGIPAFSRNSLTKQLEVPGIVLFRASYNDRTVGMILWYINKEVGYYHLGAYSDLGYELRASFALFWCAIDYFAATDLKWLNLGAGAGIKEGATNGLSRFKHGWSNGTRTAYFCGRIFDKQKYEEIVMAKDISMTDYFPAYRQGEFT